MVKRYLAKEEIEIPDNVNVTVNGLIIKVSGQKGELVKDFKHAKNILIRVEDKKVIIEKYFPSKKEEALIGTLAGKIKNMIKGVSKGFKYKMKIIYAHFPISIKVKGNYVYIENFMGEKFPRKAKIVGNVKVSVSGGEILIEGIDVEEVSQTAANIEQVTKIAYRDPRVYLDGIYVYEKE
ncbi:MAG: 50S ribosomal protein L6 [Candidatus Methanomethylicia archaeon]|nr:50S ribosomal protein L6 [Candidatus Methanomethylicia archaeon]MCX8168957.1 50S ribosomal protein L6 [Candidatus Methanomethylicia archaeon]MDW7988689.1 50S ribosomal protein L6 [Nitrososphaerota archaeon]